jgi:hypothetical protein
MIHRALALCLAAFPAGHALDPATPATPSAGIEIHFVFDAAQATLDALSGTRTDFAEIAKLPGNVRLLAQQRKFDPTATPGKFARDLEDVAAGRKPEPDTFVLLRTKDRLADARGLLARVREHPESVAGTIRSRIARYTPAGVRPNVTVYFIAGGTSDGFAEGEAFSLAVDYFKDDLAGMETLMAHELFHVAYAAARARRENPTPTSEGGKLLPLFEDTMNEGIASRVGDPLAVSDGKGWIDWFRGKFRRNFERLEATFALFDTVLYREARDPSAPIDRLYQIGFTGSWDSAFYFIGYEMARVIEEEDGAKEVARLVGVGPLPFFTRYLEISRMHPERVRYRFAASTEETIRKLSSRS